MAEQLCPVCGCTIGEERYEWELKDKLEAAGFQVSDAINHGFIHSIYTYDPNGIPIEFSHNVEGIDIRKEPQMRDQAPSRVTHTSSGTNSISRCRQRTVPR